MIKPLANYIAELKEMLNKLNFQQLVVNSHIDSKYLNFIIMEESIKMLIQNFINSKILIMYYFILLN